MAGEDQIYVSTEAKIVNHQVIAWSDMMSDPKHAGMGGEIILRGRYLMEEDYLQHLFPPNDRDLYPWIEG